MARKEDNIDRLFLFLRKHYSHGLRGILLIVLLLFAILSSDNPELGRLLFLFVLLIVLGFVS